MPQTAITPKKLDSLGLSHSKLNERYMSMERIQEADKDTDSEDDDDDDDDDEDDDDDDDDDIAKSVDDDNLESVSQRGGDARNYNGYLKTFFYVKGLNRDLTCIMGEGMAWWHQPYDIDVYVCNNDLPSSRNTRMVVNAEQRVPISLLTPVNRTPAVYVRSVHGSTVCRWCTDNNLVDNHACYFDGNYIAARPPMLCRTVKWNSTIRT